MRVDFKEVITAWVTRLNPSERQKELADKRHAICATCPSRKEGILKQEWSHYCEKCGCPLAGKIFTQSTYLTEGGSCPLGKWEAVEKEYLDKYFKKTNTLL